MTSSIAIVGMACQYPEASSPDDLWSNALAGRRAFRRMPSVRMNRNDYLSADRTTPDATYILEAAVIEGYEFDRVKYRVAGGTYRSADLAHWLALDVASRALADAGFADGAGLPKESTGVLLGNTLTGEFSRANVMRLRWPYVRRVLDHELAEIGWGEEHRASFLERVEEQYKEPFPPIGEESLAGGLSNTIAGRICNYFDLKGGGYTVDGACASSLLATANACSALASGDLDVVLAGGVDLSLDPFELVGFAKTGALAPERMRIYDARSAGFWPGEGCGFVVLMRREDAIAQRRRIYAVIKGWGISSDGNGGITRPEVDGQIIALRRAYKRAGFGIESIGYFEGHGTGTNVGDATELQTLSKARRESGEDVPPAVIGSVKAIIGHTKAAAGVAGLIKATMALHNQILPPTVGCETPHAELSGDAPALKPLGTGMLWPESLPHRAAVSSMGFGGINTHIVLEGAADERRHRLTTREEKLLRSSQDAELFLLGGKGPADLIEQVDRLIAIAHDLARSEMVDLADHLAHTLSANDHRAAIVASTPAELADRLVTLRASLTAGGAQGNGLDATRGIFVGAGTRRPVIGFLFPGQGSPANLDGGIMRRRFEEVEELYDRAQLPTGGDGISTDVAQPAIVTASLAALRTLERFGVEGDRGIGHSLGELTALHWGGAFDEDALLRIARVRGRAMADLGAPTGAMASIAAPASELEPLLDGLPVVIAGYNSPRQSVVSGDATAVAAVVERAREKGLHATRLPVSHAFHSPLVAAAAEPLADALRGERIAPLRRRVFSTVTAEELIAGADLVDLLYQQITSPVRFVDAFTALAGDIDLLIEVGPGTVLSGLAGAIADVPTIAVDAGGASLKGLLTAVGAAYALGAPVDHRELFADRFARPFDIDRPRRFFENPCEHAPAHNGAGVTLARVAANGSNGANGNGHARHELSVLEIAANGIAHGGDRLPPLPKLEPRTRTEIASEPASAAADHSAIEVVRALVAGRAELPVDAVGDDDRLLGDLHLNSITISQIVSEAAKTIGLPPPVAPTEFAGATVRELAAALEELHSTGGDAAPARESIPAGVESWVRAFRPALVTLPPIAPAERKGGGSWKIFAPDGHPLADSLSVALNELGGNGVAVALPPRAEEESVSLLLGAVAELSRTRGESFILLTSGGGAAGFARTLALERPSLRVLVVDLPFQHPSAIEWIAAEATLAEGYTEIHYDAAGVRRAPQLELLSLPSVEAEAPLGEGDILLVTGGGKGIAAESALALASTGGARLLLIGRSDPASDEELAANLARMRDAGIRFEYISADVVDAEGVAAAIARGEKLLGGRVTAFLHGAGSNVPQLIEGLTPDHFARTLAPKLDGVRNVLAAVDPERLRLFITFSSIIGRTGLRGEADYAVANELLTRITEEWRVAHQTCRCLAIEWSIWSGVGMGERLGRVEALMRDGILPITPEAGIDILRRLLASPIDDVAVVVAARFGELPTARLPKRELPLVRFLERPRVYYPGLELVADATLSRDNDPYVDEHLFRGERLFPAVIGLEAFTQAASALMEEEPERVVFENVRFNRPVVAPESGGRTIRIAALRHESGVIDLALRSEETAYQIDHFSASCRFESRRDEDAGTWSPPTDRISFDADAEMYREILFQRGRFRRVKGYRMLRATECFAEIESRDLDGWFGRYLPGTLLLGDAGARDACIHGIQGCIPHMTLLPVSVERIVIEPRAAATGAIIMHARERKRDGNNYLYDIEVHDEHGEFRERWDGLLLRAVERNRHQGPWAPPLLGPYIERVIGEMMPRAGLSVAVKMNGVAGRKGRSDSAMKEVLGAGLLISRRSDGKPVVDETINVSVAHAGEITLAVAAAGAVGCDIEPIASRSEALWRDLLGEDRFTLAGVVAREMSEDLDTAATRVWAAAESLKKAGALLDVPLMLGERGLDGWVTLASNTHHVGTYAEPRNEGVEGLVVAVVTSGGEHD